MNPKGADEVLNDEFYMKEALCQARLAAELGEVPVGAVIVWDGEIVGVGHNRRETGKNALAHAEIEAINEACTRLHGWRLHRATLYVTLEPCPMCAGAIVNARIKRVVFGAPDPKSGAMGSVFDIDSFPLNHRCEKSVGVCESECRELLQNFFIDLRERLRAKERTHVESAFDDRG